MKKTLLLISIIVLLLQSFVAYQLYVKAYNPTNNRIFKSLGEQLSANEKELSNVMKRITPSSQGKASPLEPNGFQASWLVAKKITHYIQITSSTKITIFAAL